MIRFFPADRQADIFKEDEKISGLWQELTREEKDRKSAERNKKFAFVSCRRWIKMVLPGLKVNYIRDFSQNTLLILGPVHMMQQNVCRKGIKRTLRRRTCGSRLETTRD